MSAVPPRVATFPRVMQDAPDDGAMPVTTRPGGACPERTVPMPAMNATETGR